MPDTTTGRISALLGASYVEDAPRVAFDRSLVVTATTIESNREAQSRWNRLFHSWNNRTILVRPARLYPPYASFSEMVNASIWTRWDRQANRYGVTNVTDARNRANVHTEEIVAHLLEQLEVLFGNGRFAGQNRDWLRRGIEAAGRLGMAGAVGGPYVAIATACAGFIASVVQDLWPGKKADFLAAWQAILRDCTPLERYLLWAYMREIGITCFRLEANYRDPQQPASDPWRWGTQPQPAGHNIVFAGPIGMCTFLGEILTEYDCFPEPASVRPDEATLNRLIDAERSAEPVMTDGNAARIQWENRVGALEEIKADPTKTFQDPMYTTYVAAVICADHPDNFHLRDCAHRARIFGDLNNTKGSRWIARDLWPFIRDLTVGQVKRAATNAGIQGLSPTFYTTAIDHALVDAELPSRG